MMRRVGAWVRPAQCSSLWKWIHQTWSKTKRWEGPDCVIYELWSRWFGFEFVEERSVEG